MKELERALLTASIVSQLIKPSGAPCPVTCNDDRAFNTCESGQDLHVDATIGFITKNYCRCGGTLTYDHNWYGWAWYTCDSCAMETCLDEEHKV